VSGLAPAGPERRKRLAIALRGEPGVEVKGGLSVAELGCTLHAATVAVNDRVGREALCKYVLRLPIAQERVKLLPNDPGKSHPFGCSAAAPTGDGLVRLELRRAFRDGTQAIDLDALSLLCRLAASVPPPRMHLARLAGVLSAAHKWRSREDASDETHACGKSERPATHRSGYWSWAKLLKRSLGIDADKCGKCGSRMKLCALLTRLASIERFLRRIGEPTELFPLSPARGPPFFKSRALRRKLGELDAPQGQMDMFGA
jgi:hypothetical protein